MINFRGHSLPSVKWLPSHFWGSKGHHFLTLRLRCALLPKIHLPRSCCRQQKISSLTSSPDTEGGDGDPRGKDEWRMPTAGLKSIVAWRVNYYFKLLACIFGGIALCATAPASKDKFFFNLFSKPKFWIHIWTRIRGGIFRKAKLEKPQFTKRKWGLWERAWHQNYPLWRVQK